MRVEHDDTLCNADLSYLSDTILTITSQLSGGSETRQERASGEQICQICYSLISSPWILEAAHEWLCPLFSLMSSRFGSCW